MTTQKVITGAFAALALLGCEPNSPPATPVAEQVSQAQLQHFINEIKNNLVFVEGGTLLMGDYGYQYGPERMYYDADEDSKPVHPVELRNFSMNKFKVTNAQFQFYLMANSLSLRDKGMASKQKWNSINSAPNTPAHANWYEAEQYCNWLAAVTELPFALPTEAQWEYAARSRGQFLMVATDDGTYKAEPRSLRTETYSPKGINISSRGDRIAFAKQMGWKTDSFTPLPVDMFPPNPLGIYSMTDNGYEWVNDWYDPDYYKNSPLKDPKGPDQPVFKDKLGRYTKVVRGQDNANPYWGGVNVHRTARDPYGRSDLEGSIFIASKTMRCVVNSPEPVH